AVVRPCGLADAHPGPGGLEALRGRALRGSGHAPYRPSLPHARGRLATGADRGRVRSARLHPRGGAARVRVGRAGADLLRAPRDLVGELDLPLLWPTAL